MSTSMPGSSPWAARLCRYDRIARAKELGAIGVTNSHHDLLDRLESVPLPAKTAGRQTGAVQLG
jgi:hypothetical protein